MEKRIRRIIILVVLVLIIVYGGSFLAQNIKGIIPLLKSPKSDIAVAIQKEQSPLTIPEGFSISIFADGLGKPRVLARDPVGNLMVSVPSDGKVYVLPDEDSNGVADEVVVAAEGLNKPHGLAQRCAPLDEEGTEYDCVLYIAETNQVAIYSYDRKNLKASFKNKLTDLPVGGNHTTRTLLMHPNGEELLISVGSSCNVCNEKDTRRGTVLSYSFDTKKTNIFAKGLRNSVFLRVHPNTRAVWASEMGRDLLGDDLPPDEINIIDEGKNYGWPTCFGKNIHDTDFDHNVYIRNPCLEPFETQSYIDIPAHSSPLGLAFIPENSNWPEEYWNNLLVAYHGSWNRSVPTGYKIVRFLLDEKGNILRSLSDGSIVEDFVTGWFTDSSEVLGRPVDILIDPDGTMFVSDDRTGVIYRVVYTP